MKPIEAKSELHKFVKLKTTQRPAFLDGCEEALNKQIPQNTIVDGAWNYCPACGTTIPNSFFNKPKYCHRCGQRIQLSKGD